MRFQLRRRREREPAHGELRGAVEAQPRHRRERGERPEVHDVPVPPRHHPLRGRPRPEDHPLHIDVDVKMHAPLVRLVDEPGLEKPGDVHHHVHGPEGLLRRVERLLPRFGGGHVERLCHDAPGPPGETAELREPLFVHVRRQHPVPPRREGLCQVLADPARGAREDDRLVRSHQRTTLPKERSPKLMVGRIPGKAQ